MATTHAERIEFKAEIQQVLDILIHSLYSEREVFLRELISNASDALHRFKLESLKSQAVLSPELELGIWLETDSDAHSLTVRDTGLGMTQEELVAYLGTIAHSGAKGFIEAMKELNRGDTGSTRELIGQFGVGFYSIFMVADEVTVTSRSYRPDAEAAFWRSSGHGSFEVGPAEKEERGTTIVIKLKEDAVEFAEQGRLRQVVKTHSDFVAFPIYLPQEAEGEDEESGWVRANQQTAIWREQPHTLEQERAETFYQQLTFDFDKPLRTIHFAADVPIQFYAMLFVPSKRDYRLLGPQDDHGLRLYARKILIDERFKDLLPPYLRFIEGVVDSEDLPLNVSRETVQASPTIDRIRKALIGRVTSELTKLAEEDKDTYQNFYREFGIFLKEGIATDPSSLEKLQDLLRFPSSESEGPDDWVSLQQLFERMPASQKEIYYLLGDDPDLVAKSAHLDAFRERDLEVLFLTDPIDSFMLMGLTSYKGKPFRSIDDAGLELPESEDESDQKAEPKLADETFNTLLTTFKEVLGERVTDVRESKILRSGAARLVNPAGGSASNVERVQRLMQKDFQVPSKILELNRSSPLIENLSDRLSRDAEDPLIPLIIEQLFETELLAEGLHPNPAEMASGISRLLTELSKSGRE